MICFSGWPEAGQTLHCAWRALPPWPWTPSPVSQCLDGALPTSGEIQLPNLSLHNPTFQSEGLAPSLAGGLCPLRDGSVSPRSPFLLWELGRYQSRPELQSPPSGDHIPASGLLRGAARGGERAWVQGSPRPGASRHRHTQGFISAPAPPRPVHTSSPELCQAGDHTLHLVTGTPGRGRMLLCLRVGLGPFPRCPRVRAVAPGCQAQALAHLDSPAALGLVASRFADRETGLWLPAGLRLLGN